MFYTFRKILFQTMIKAMIDVSSLFNYRLNIFLCDAFLRNTCGNLKIYICIQIRNIDYLYSWLSLKFAVTVSNDSVSLSLKDNAF